MCVCDCIYVHAYMYGCVCVYIYMHVYVCLYMCDCVYVCMCMWLCVYMCRCGRCSCLHPREGVTSAVSWVSVTGCPELFCPVSGRCSWTLSNGHLVLLTFSHPDLHSYFLTDAAFWEQAVLEQGTQDQETPGPESSGSRTDRWAYSGSQAGVCSPSPSQCFLPCDHCGPVML